MKRRDFMRLAAASTLIAAAPAGRAAAIPTAAIPSAAIPPTPSALPGSGWRRFELQYDLDLSGQTGTGRVWLPLPADASDYQRVESITWSAAPPDATLSPTAADRAPVFSASSNGAQERRIVVTSVIATRDRVPASIAPDAATTADAQRYLLATASMPTDGIVAATASKIVAGIDDPDARARAIYDWVVDNTERNPATRGCGMGNIKFMLETGDLSGKCADLNSLFVGLARAAGVPAREMYGVRLAASNQFASLGKAGGDVSKAHHCRAEYFSPRSGWVAVDPADVRKAVLEEKLPLTDPRIVALRERLFGQWEMNWVGFNTARDFQLVPTASEPLPYLMYPYAEFGETVLDGREPETFRFVMRSVEPMPSVAFLNHPQNRC